MQAILGRTLTVYALHRLQAGSYNKARCRDWHFGNMPRWPVVTLYRGNRPTHFELSKGELAKRFQR